MTAAPLLLAALPLAALAAMRRYGPIHVPAPAWFPRRLEWAADGLFGSCWQAVVLCLFAAAELAGVVTPASLGFVTPGELGDDGRNVLLLLLGCAALAPIAAEILSGATPGVLGADDDDDGRSFLGGLAGSCLLAPFAEELYFRGFLFPLASPPVGPLASAALSSAAFAVVHSYDLAGRVSVFFSGLAMAWVVWKTGSVWPAVALHATANAAVELRRMAVALFRPAAAKEAA